jgi:hypothetical protein
MKVVETVKQNWEVGRTVWKASTTWKGGFKVETCSREFTLLADERIGGTPSGITSP